MSRQRTLSRPGLDPVQLAFAQDPDTGLRLLAPAGSGKTHSLLWRCLHRAEASGKANPRFLLFTFTRAARDELRDRLRDDPNFAPIQPLVEITTLNAWGFRRLKQRSHNLRIVKGSGPIYNLVHNNLQPVWSKYPPLKEVLTQPRTKARAASAVISISDGLKSLGFRHDKENDLRSFREHSAWLVRAGLKPYLVSVLDAFGDLGLESFVQDFENGLMPFWTEATQTMWQMATITLEDQKYWAMLDLEQSIADNKYTTGIHRFSHIMVDEFQDINCLDLALLKAIAKVNKTSLTIVGDDDQAIYEWRGASPRFIFEPESYIGGQYRTHVLTTNYRSPANIVELSGKLIAHNKHRVAKAIAAHSAVKAQIEVLPMDGIAESAQYVLDQVKSLLGDPKTRNLALIGRKRGQIIPYQIVFAKNNIPFYAAEDLQVFLSEAFNGLRDLLAIRARASLGAIPGLDPVQDLLKLADKAKRYPLSKADRAALLKHLQSERPKSFLDCVNSLRRYSGALKGSNDDAKMSNEIADLILAYAHSDTVSESLHVMSKFDGLKKDYGKALEDIFYTDPPFSHLADFAVSYGSNYSDFIADLDTAASTLARTPDSDESEAADPDRLAPVHLMTALRAKGKEFDTVFILECNQGIWPSKLAETEAQLEQERRVFYVAFTRARERIVMMVNGRVLGQSAVPSPYLVEMGLI